ncbi:MAG: 5-oxoprolinase subunit B family protein [Nocardioidaceae bacterium]
MRFLPVGVDALLVECEDPPALFEAALGLRAGFTDAVPAAETVLFLGVDDVAALESSLSALRPGRSGGADRAVVEVPTVYDGADISSVAELWEMTEREVVATHTSTEFTVAFCGFAPGFAYCTGLPAERSVPRLDSPRSRVPAGSVGLAGEYTGVYPSASPGGWRLLGHTELTLWDVSRDEPAVLSPGTRVRFVEVTR